MSETICIFHAHCIDGHTAAWAVWRALGYDNTRYLPAQFGDAAPDVRDQHVIIVDFSYKRDVLEKMQKEALSLIVLDHHKTAQADLEGLSYTKFDMERSGAGMAWDHFHPDVKRPWLVNYVEDRDLWRFKLPQSKEINAWIGAQKRNRFEDWTELFKSGSNEAFAKGRCVLTYMDRYVEEMSDQARCLKMFGYDFVVPVVNAPYVSISELVGHLAREALFAVGWFQREDGMFQYSLRSRPPHGWDVSEIAKRFGGGGHKHAAGFFLPYLLKEITSREEDRVENSTY